MQRKSGNKGLVHGKKESNICENNGYNKKKDVSCGHAQPKDAFRLDKLRADQFFFHQFSPDRADKIGSCHVNNQGGQIRSVGCKNDGHKALYQLNLEEKVHISDHYERPDSNPYKKQAAVEKRKLHEP